MIVVIAASEENSTMPLKGPLLFDYVKNTLDGPPQASYIIVLGFTITPLRYNIRKFFSYRLTYSFSAGLSHICSKARAPVWF